MSFARSEMAQLKQLLRELGPHAPTLCEGWETKDLARHNLLRQQPWRFRQKLSYEDTINLWKPTPVDDVVNTVEYFIHHEDVRRANGMGPREFSTKVEKMLLEKLKVFAPILLRKEKPIMLVPEGFPAIVLGDRGVASRGDAVTKVMGKPSELILWAWGRRQAADVT